MSNEYSGLFVTVEGIDGSGKSTVVEAINEEFPDVVNTQEPSELWTGKAVRRALANDTGDVDPLATFYLFMADRVHHVREEIEPGLEQGRLVVSDRYADSTRAYQPWALQDSVRKPEKFINSTMSPWDFEPDLTIYLDVSVETAMERLEGGEIYEKEDFLSRVSTNYSRLAKRNSHRWNRVDAEQSEEAVRQEVVEIVKNHWQG